MTSTTTLRLPRESTPEAVPAQESLEANGMAVDSSKLLQGNKTVTIKHNGLLYRLQATRLGKLILTK